MNEIKTLRVSEHLGCPIYVRNWGEVFEYLAVIRGQIYAAHNVIRRAPWQRLLGRPFTPKQLADCVAVTLKMAEATVEAVSAPQPKETADTQPKKKRK